MNAINKNDKTLNAQAEVTALIVEQLKEFETTGEAPAFLQPWDAQGGLSWPCNLDGVPYNGINVLHLLAIQKKRGYPMAAWGTYKAFSDKVAQVQKGEKSATAFFYKSLKVEDKDEQGKVRFDEEGNPKQIDIPMMKCYAIFNRAQTDLDQAPAPQPSENFAGLAAAIQAAGVDIRNGVDKAYYDRVSDFVRMPNLEQFQTEGDYWATLAHEAMHWTGAETRLARKNGKVFGDEDYSMEELTAELGAVMLLAQFGIKPMFQNTAYLASWIKALNADHKLIFKIAAQAQKAANYFTKAEAEQE